MTSPDLDNKESPLDFIIIAVVCLIIIGTIFFSSFSDEAKTPKTSPETALARMGKPTDKFDGLLSKIKDDIGRKDIEIKVRIGPYLKSIGFTGLLDFDIYTRTYYVLIDDEFYNELNEEEQKALVAHETGHILFGVSFNGGRKGATEIQKLADLFAMQYVRPEYMASLLDKVYFDYLARKEQAKLLMRAR